MKKSLLVFIGVVSILCGCTQKENVTPPAQPKEEVEYEISFSEQQYNLELESSCNIEFQISPADSAHLVSFAIADQKIASIEKIEGSTINVKSNAMGSTTLVATVADKMASCSINVGPIEVKEILFEQTTVEMKLNTSLRLGIKILPENSTNPQVEWSSTNEMVAVVDHGLVYALSEGECQIVASCGQVSASCKVVVSATRVESVVLDKAELALVEGESYLFTATAYPVDASFFDFKWSVSDSELLSLSVVDAVEGDNQICAKVVAQKPGSASVKVSVGSVSAECLIEIASKEPPVIPAKVGDYYYSDGTWSDGTVAPIEGKTVIGIVFQVDQSRISKAEKDKGFTNGLVVCTMAAHAPDAKLTKYSIVPNFDTVPVKRAGTSWYEDIDGYTWTQKVVAEMGANIQKAPAFDWVTTDFKPAAPANTSDWYIPSIGQVWDILENLGGEQVKNAMAPLRTYSSDITYYSKYSGEIILPFNLIEEVNKAWAAVRVEQKEDLFVSRDRGGFGVAEIMSSTLYDNTDGVCCVFWLGDNGLLEPTVTWTDDQIICHPILSF